LLCAGRTTDDLCRRPVAVDESLRKGKRMEILLCQDVENLGRLGDVVEVADGYARNYLLPKKLAVPVTAANTEDLRRAREARSSRERDEMERIKEEAGKLEGFLCFVPLRATEEGHLFGSVGPTQIAEVLAESGFERVRAASVNLERHLEEVGDYQVEVMLHPEVRVNITVRIAALEEEQPEESSR